ncbi:MAG TPA: serine/threonine-protein kinase [Bryobacteraceae bacterium]|jgi:serine/threonine-protein kinase|nr:serine/threonine-protein kinase [Bryobacteraceae bacterium]
MDRKIDPSTVETTLDPSPTARPASSSSVSQITSALLADEGRFVAGTLLGGRYRIIGLLGRGGMGEVYRATDMMLGQSVALKFLPAEASSNPRLLERFHGEVRVARQVSHPNVCRVYDIGEIEGMPFISMEYVDGEDLADLLLRIGRLPSDKALETARKLCAGLAAAHERGVIHRDLKPQNIMMNKRGEVVIMDFGLAAIADQLSGDEVRNGTPAYMAPEQLKGSEVTARSDIYSLGLVLYEIFTGKKPFDAKNVRQLIEMQESIHLPSMTSSAADIDPMVEKAIRRCLDPDPAKRPASALSVAMALPGGDPLAAALAAGETPSPELVASAGHRQGMPRRYAILCLAGLAICLAADVFISGREVAVFNSPADYSPDVLANKAREMAVTFGYPAKPADSAVWLTDLDGYLPHLNQVSDPRIRIAWLGAEPSVLAVYRQSPNLLVAQPYGDIEVQNPPAITPGMVQVNLNTAGYLRKFEAIPPGDGGALANPVTAEAVFHAAGLDLTKFTEIPAKFAPLGAADEVHAWKGPHPKIPGLDFTVEMAAWKGRLTRLHIIYDWKGDPPAAAAQSVTSQVRGFVLIGMSAAGLLAAMLLARRNWKLGRVDRKGALRIGTARFLMGLVVWLGTVHAVPSADMINLGISSFATWLAWGAALWLLYLALEPSVRAHWPHSLVTWNRLLGGEWKDARLASHVLIGAAVGAAVWTTAAVLDLLSHADMGSSSGISAALGARQWIAVHTNTVAGDLGIGLLLFFALTGLRQLVKRDWVAAAIAAAFFTFSNSGNFTSSNWQVKTTVYLFVFGMLLMVVLRYGLVSIIAAAFFIDTFDSLGLGGDWKAWYTPAGLATASLLAGIAIYAFWRSLGSRAFEEATG